MHPKVTLRPPSAGLHSLVQLTWVYRGSRTNPPSELCQPSRFPLALWLLPLLTGHPSGPRSSLVASEASYKWTDISDILACWKQKGQTDTKTEEQSSKGDQSPQTAHQPTGGRGYLVSHIQPNQGGTHSHMLSQAASLAALTILLQMVPAGPAPLRKLRSSHLRKIDPVFIMSRDPGGKLNPKTQS